MGGGRGRRARLEQSAPGPRRLAPLRRHAPAALEPTGVVLSWEIYNEENVDLWWEGTLDAFAQTCAAASGALGLEAVVFPGGLVWPDEEWMAGVCREAAVDVAAVHAYPETWTPDSVRVENYLGRHFEQVYLPAVREACGNVPVWVNEMGFATAGGATEADQAAIGDPENHHLGLFRADGTPKHAHATVGFLIDRLQSPALVRRPLPGLHGAAFRTADGAETIIAWHPVEAASLELPRGDPGRRSRFRIWPIRPCSCPIRSPCRRLPDRGTATYRRKRRPGRKKGTASAVYLLTGAGARVHPHRTAVPADDP